MAYVQNQSQPNRGSYSNNRSNTSAAAAPARKSDSIQVAGFYNHEGKDGKPSKLAMKSGKLKEAITIPAGHVLKLFVKGGLSKNGKTLPDFELVAQPVQVRT